MKRCLVVASGCVVVCSFVLLARSNAPKPEDQIVQLERDWLAAEASADMPTLERLIADDFMGTAFGPGILTKSDIVPSGGDNANRLPKSFLEESTVHVFGDTAVLMGWVLADDKKLGGLRVTTVFQKRPPGWQIIATHMSRAPGSAQ